MEKGKKKKSKKIIKILKELNKSSIIRRKKMIIIK